MHMTWLYTNDTLQNVDTGLAYSTYQNSAVGKMDTEIEARVVEERFYVPSRLATAPTQSPVESALGLSMGVKWTKRGPDHPVISSVELLTCER